MTVTIPEQFSIHIKMTSDWHVGSGSGRGEVDSVVQLDADNLPYIPAKTLTGILRDGCEQVAQALDGRSTRGSWNNWVNVLFGDQPATLDPSNSNDREQLEKAPRPAALSIGSVHLDHALKTALAAKPNLKSTITFIKPGVAIDATTGSAKPDFLRFEEVVRMGTILAGTPCCFDFSTMPEISETQKKAAYALLIAGTKMVARLGGKRRRGNGNCTITIHGDKGVLDSNEWIRWLQKHYEAITEPPAWTYAPLSCASGENPKSDASWYTVPLTITTLSPIILPKRTVGNVVECLDYVPGRYLLGFLHKKLGGKLNINQAIAHGRLILTNATIAIDDEPGRPTPFCLFGEKLDGGLNKGKDVYNLFQEEEPEDIQLKGERCGYIGPFQEKSLPKHETISLELYTHNTIYDPDQRPTREVGGVYSYQAIPGKTVLKTELRLPESIKEHLDQTSVTWWSELKGKLRIGQSKKDQYGLVEITPQEPTQCLAENANSFKEQSDPSELYVWFLSDVLLRNQRLAPTTDPVVLKRTLENELGVKLQERLTSESLLSMMMRSRRTESWQVRWGLPRPTLLGWQAGSCVVYQVQGEIQPDQLIELEAKGIGDRRVEGYGQICFNHPLLMTNLKDKKGQSSQSQTGDTGSNTSGDDVTIYPNKKLVFDYARTIEKAAWREAIENRAFAIAAQQDRRTEILGLKIEPGDPPKSHPPMSQLGGLRSNVRHLQALADQTKVVRWLTALESVSNRKEKWQHTSDGLKKIRDLVTNPQLVWQILDVPWQDLTMTADGRNQLQEVLWAESVRMLMDVVIRAHKRDLEKAQRKAA